MRKSETDLIESHARQFRAALERCDARSLTVAFEDFPRGACGDASLLLAMYLNGAGLGPFDYVCGELRDGRGGFQTHAWLQKGFLIIDITADQFDDAPGPVIVTRGLNFHGRFKVARRHSADLEMYDEGTKRILSAAYQSVGALIHPLK